MVRLDAGWEVSVDSTLPAMPAVLEESLGALVFVLPATCIAVIVVVLMVIVVRGRHAEHPDRER
jgi:hypothetical protein